MTERSLTSKYLCLAAAAALALAPTISAQAPDDREAPPSFTDDIREQVEAFRALQEQLVQERRDFGESLQGLSDEERQAAIEAFREENADRVAAQRELGELISEQVKAASAALAERPDRPEQEAPERPEVAAEVQSMIEEFRTAREALLQERREVLEQYREASQEDREQALADLRENQREAIEAQKELARSIRGEIADLRENRRERS